MRNNNIFIFSLIISLSLGIFGFTGCGGNSYHTAEGMVWNTMYHITYKGDATLEDSILATLEEVGKSLSVFDTTSLVSTLNRDDSVLADSHLKRVYESSLKVNKTSKGMFDPTVSPLVNAWGFGIGHKATADTTAIDSILQFVGISKTRFSNGYIVKEDRRIQFNFSGVAKGYGCDAIGEMFRRNGVTDYMVEIGGEIALSGLSPSGEDWKISIDAPIEETGSPSHESMLVVSLTDKGIATSGNYRNFRKDGNGTVAHTISPMTGRPVMGSVLSASVITDNCVDADAIATACMASDVENAKNILSELGADGLLIFADTVWMTPGFSKYIIEEVSVPGNKVRN